MFVIALELFYCAVETEREPSLGHYETNRDDRFRAFRTLWMNVPFTVLLISLSWVVGMVIFAHYFDCDPKQLGYISDIDEILPFYIEDKFVFLPGFLGLTMACLFNGALRYVSAKLPLAWSRVSSNLERRDVNIREQVFRYSG